MFRNRCRNLGVDIGKHLIAVFASMILALSFLSTELLATGEQGELKPPVAATVHKVTGETIEALIQSFDAKGFTVSSKGRALVIAWRELTAKDVFALHEKILTNPKGLDWFELGRLLWKFPDGKRYAVTAFTLAEEMEPSLKKAIEDVQKDIPVKPTSQSASKSENALDYLEWLPESALAVTCMTMDAQGNTWIGTEDDGVYLHRAATDSGRQLSHYTTDDGIGDNDIFAIKCDRIGRIWVGHARHGVSVFCNGRWKNYDVPDGPIGDRVWAIVECPLDGDIWIASNAGLTRYSSTKNTWRHYTPGQVPYADRICSIAFDGKGRLFAATDCEGLVKCEREGGEYRSWTRIRGPRKTPQAGRGAGLPSGLLNDVLVASDQSVWAATDGGLAWSRDAGATWQFLRGEDWVQKVYGLRNRPATPVDEGVKAGLLPEDYLNCLAEDRQGNIWMGCHEQGLVFLDPRTFTVTRLDKKSQGWKAGTTFCLLPQQDGCLLIGDYCGGAARLRQSTTALAPILPATSHSVAKPPPSRFPATASPPTLPELNALCKELWTVPVLDKEDRGIIVPMPDDWRTQGKWLGRYGRYWACICAIDSPSDYLWGAGAARVQYYAGIGSNHDPGDSQRYWVNRLYTEDARVLEMPPVYMDSRIKKKLTTPNLCRREAAWDDHGEGYSRYHEGPDLVGNLDIPSGRFILSFYFQDQGVHCPGSAVRDYILSLRVLAEGKTSIEETADQSDLTETRVHDFYHGVYKRFLVQGPIRIGYKVDRNYSVNTTLVGIMLDLPEECPPPYFQTESKWEEARRNRDVKLAQTAAARKERPQAIEYTTEREAVFAAMQQVQDLQDLNPKWWAAHSRKFYVPLFCWLKACKPDQEILAGRAQCCHALCLFDQWESYQGKFGLATARSIEHQLKWDEKTASFSGAGNRVVTRFVEETREK